VVGLRLERLPAVATLVPCVGTSPGDYCSQTSKHMWLYDTDSEIARLQMWLKQFDRGFEAF